MTGLELVAAGTLQIMQVLNLDSLLAVFDFDGYVFFFFETKENILIQKVFVQNSRRWDTSPKTSIILPTKICKIVSKSVDVPVDVFPLGDLYFGSYMQDVMADWVKGPRNVCCVRKHVNNAFRVCSL